MTVATAQLSVTTSSMFSATSVLIVKAANQLSKPQKKKETTFLIGGPKIPVYDFKCECGKTSTITIQIADVDKFKTSCVCGKPMTRVFGVGAVTFKGSGWGGSR